MAPTTVRIDNYPQRSTPPQPRQAIAGDPIILLVEDDWGARRFMSTLLKYVSKALVIEASDAHQALTAAEVLRSPVRLLVSDIGLPGGKNGIDLAREMTARDPSLRVLLMSAGDFPQCDVPPSWRFLPKPFPIGEFLDLVNELCRSFKPARTQPHHAKTRAAA
jgi:DNA-binding NtrC family response regulator